MVSAIHTHSGPAVEALADEMYPAETQSLVVPGIVDACVKAYENASPMRLWTATGREELAGKQILKGKCWTTPVLSGGRIYARNTPGDIVCYGVK